MAGAASSLACKLFAEFGFAMLAFVCTTGDLVGTLCLDLWPGGVAWLKGLPNKLKPCLEVR